MDKVWTVPYAEGFRVQHVAAPISVLHCDVTFSAFWRARQSNRRMGRVPAGCCEETRKLFRFRSDEPATTNAGRRRLLTDA